MALERRNPLPPGKYWIDQFEAKGGILRFDAWLRRESKTVRVLQREEHPADLTAAWDPIFHPGEGGSVARKLRVWYLFEVLKPTLFEKGLGLPTIVPTSTQAPPVTKSDDTVTKPKVEEPRDVFARLAGDAKTILLVGGLLYLLTRKS